MNWGYISKDYVISGACVDLSDSARAWEALDKRVRTSVRKGKIMGVAIRPLNRKSSEELSFLRSITPNAEDIPVVFEDRHFAYVAQDEKNGELLGWILLAGVSRKLFMLCHASTKDGKRRQTPNLLLWHAIETHAKGPYAYFDVGASFRATLQNYFQGFRQGTYPMILKPPELPIDLHITPFDTAVFGEEPGNPENGRDHLAEAFGTDEFTVFPRAMYAIAACLRELREDGRLLEDDEVFVTTTTDSPYISGCVTRAIESVCRWSQTVSDRTRAVFMIHEFGFPHPQAAKWRVFCDERKIPLIEDLAYGWGTEGIGQCGDYKIYSATKIFPVQFGGFLVKKKIPPERLWSIHKSQDLMKEKIVLGMLDAHWQSLDEICSARQKTWHCYVENLCSVLDPYFDIPSWVVPGAFLLRMKDEEEMKRVSAFVRQFGVEVGNWYHHASIFLPCHQRMTKRHVDFVSGAVLANFREGCGISYVSPAVH